jgi:hypothetical protein
VSVTLSADLSPDGRRVNFPQYGDASLGDHTGAQVEKDGGQPVIFADLSHACHTGESRRLPFRRDFRGGKTSGMAAIVHDGDVSAGYQLFKCEAQSSRTSPGDEQGRYRWIGGGLCWCECMDGADSVMLPKAKLLVEAGGVLCSNY